MRITNFLAKLACAFGLLALLAADPATQPGAGPDTSIANDQYHFPAPSPDDWNAVKPDPKSDSITFLNKTQDGAIQLVLLAKDASVDDNVAVAIVRTLKESHTARKDVVVMAPKIEKDKRFDIVVHEKYKVGERVADQLHIYKSVGPRVLMLTVNSVADDDQKTAAIQAAGEDMLAAAKFNRKAFKPGN